ncbi:hypothetical protein KM043_013461 [Ampulex compressa]|nr:hypothetical protein KM043_013461 [Ampulex compressa]
MHYDSSKKFWLLAIEGLKSTTQQDRKQALFVMKRAVECIITGNITLVNTPVAIQRDEAIVRIWQTFFLVFEALEEKQYHLIVPALTHVATLIEENQEYGSYSDGFNVICLRVLYGRIFNHENNTIVKWGICSACTLPTIIFDDEFLELFLNALNNTFLYEYQPCEEEPGFLLK